MSYKLVVVAMTREFSVPVVAAGAAVAAAVGTGVTGVELVHPARRIVTKMTAITDAINPTCTLCFIILPSSTLRRGILNVSF